VAAKEIVFQGNQLVSSPKQSPVKHSRGGGSKGRGGVASPSRIPRQQSRAE
jgi:hypothetical protein